MAAKNPWPVWRGYCYRTRPAGASKTEKNRFERTIQREWASIREHHSDDHMQLKRQLSDAIERIKVMEVRVRRYTNIIQDLEEHHRANVPGGQYLPVERYERAALAALEHLGAVEILIGVEELIGLPTQRMRLYEETVRQMLREIAVTASNMVRTVRAHEDGTGAANTATRNARQQRVQRNMEVQPMPEGRMQYIHLADSKMATVGLWLSGDEHGRVIDRLAVKDTWYMEQPFWWTDQAWWRGDARDLLNRVPAEVHIMQRLNATNAENILKMKAWNARPHLRLVRLFLEYCPYGDGADVIFQCLDDNWKNKNKESGIPEPAVWHFFESLVLAGSIMEKGAYENPSPRWSPIVHLDFKPEHMMLSDYPSQAGLTENFAMYPAVKLADFGLSIDGCKSHRPQSFFPGRGTPGFFAPEQKRKYHGNVRPDLNAKTNVWGVGATIMATMKLNIDTSNLEFGEAAQDEGDPALVPKINDIAKARYSQPLRDMVTDCVQFRQADRPTFDDLLINIRRLTGMGGDGATDHAQGARFAKRDAKPQGLKEMPGMRKEKEYAIGMAMPA